MVSALQIRRDTSVCSFFLSCQWAAATENKQVFRCSAHAGCKGCSSAPSHLVAQEVSEVMISPTKPPPLELIIVDPSCESGHGASVFCVCVLIGCQMIFQILLLRADCKVRRVTGYPGTSVPTYPT